MPETLKLKPSDGSGFWGYSGLCYGIVGDTPKKPPTPPTQSTDPGSFSDEEPPTLRDRPLPPLESPTRPGVRWVRCPKCAGSGEILDIIETERGHRSQRRACDLCLGPGRVTAQVFREYEARNR